MTDHDHPSARVPTQSVISDPESISSQGAISYQSRWVDRIVSFRRPLDPIPTGIDSSLQKLDQVRCVVFDVYGTLLISGSGDVGSADTTSQADHMADAFADCGIDTAGRRVPTAASLRQVIQAINHQAKSPACPKPEVDIATAWRRLLASEGLAAVADDAQAVVRLATAYEARSNPVWPMPGAASLISKLKVSGVTMGIVSNAQIFTPALVENLCGASSLEDAGFDLDLSIFSNRFRQSKPGPKLFEVLVDALAIKGILPQQAVYVGNDMLNDVYAASVAGLRTAWFVGDRRSCRRRLDEQRCHGVKPDIVLDCLDDLQKCLCLH